MHLCSSQAGPSSCLATLCVSVNHTPTLWHICLTSFPRCSNVQHSCFPLTISSWLHVSFYLENRSHRKSSSLSPLVLRCSALLRVRADELLGAFQTIFALGSILSCFPSTSFLQSRLLPFPSLFCSSPLDHVWQTNMSFFMKRIYK